MKARRCRFMIFVVSIFLGISLLYVVGGGVRHHSGIRVEVQNLSGEEVRDVSIKVEYRGKRYSLPNLKPGDKEQIYVEPVTESHVVAEFTRANGERQSKVIFGYAEEGYCGSSEVTVFPGNKLESKEDFNCGSSWFDVI